MLASAWTTSPGSLKGVRFELLTPFAQVEQDHFREGERAWREAKALDQVPASPKGRHSLAQDAAGVTR